jgi:NitT/TauT family transport system ATP-binding protein
MDKMNLTACELTKIFQNGGSGIVVFENLSLTAKSKEFLSVVGPSGCGKTTLLHILGGLLPKTSGSVMLDGKELTHPDKSISYVLQESSLFPWKTTFENVEFAPTTRFLPRAEKRAIAEKYISMVGLDNFQSFYPHQLSGGMQQRVVLARALASESEILLMDEPLASLDPRNRERLQEEISQIHNALKRTIVLVSHDMEEVCFLSSRIIVLSDRPARILEEIIMPFPFPRKPELRASKEFQILKTHIWEIIRGIIPNKKVMEEKEHE